VIDKNKKVTVTLQPPLHSLGFNTPLLARRGEKPKMEFTIWVEYNLADYYSNISSTTKIFSKYSKQEYFIL